MSRNYTPDEIRQVRKYGIDDLKGYVAKLKENIKVFEEAIAKEKKEIVKARGMIKSLEEDRRVQRKIKRMLRKG